MSYKFHTLLLECKELINSQTRWKYFPNETKKDIINKLDQMMIVFPEISKNLSALHFDWDDTIRLVIDYVPEEEQYRLLKTLINSFPNINGMWISWGSAEKEIEAIRKDVLLKYYTPSGENEDLVKALMQDIYNIEV